MTIRTIFALLTCAASVYGCSVTENFVFPTVAEQANAAAVIVQAQITSVVDIIPFNVFEAEATVLDVLKGCAPQTIRISGFQSSSLCGVDPVVGETGYFFLCAPEAIISPYSLIEGIFVGKSPDDEESSSALEAAGVTEGQQGGCLQFSYAPCTDVFANRDPSTPQLNPAPDDIVIVEPGPGSPDTSSPSQTEAPTAPPVDAFSATTLSILQQLLSSLTSILSSLLRL